MRHLALGEPVKYFRMDGDLPFWDETVECLRECGHKGFTLWIMLYSLLADKFTGEEEITISFVKLCRQSKISQKTARKLLEKLQKIYTFEILSWQKSDTFFTVFYPKFLEKQKIPKRYGDGKFARTVDNKNKIESKNKNNKEHPRFLHNSESEEIPPSEDDPSPPIELPPGMNIDQEKIAQIAGNLPPKARDALGEKIKKKKNDDKFNDFDKKCAEFLIAVVTKLNEKFDHAPKIGVAKVDVWADQFRLLRTRDKASEMEIKYVLGWAMKEDFWRFRIQSAEGLRNNWDEVRSQWKQSLNKTVNYGG